MARTEDVVGLYTRRARTYPAYVQASGHGQSLRSLLERFAALAPGQRILDAGCGTGLSTLAITDVYARAGLRRGPIDAFDLTPAMIDAYRATVHRARLADVAVQRTDVLAVNEQLPEGWVRYDLIVSVSMLEYVPHERLGEALGPLSALGRRGPAAGAVDSQVVGRRAFAHVRSRIRLWRGNRLPERCDDDHALRLANLQLPSAF